MFHKELMISGLKRQYSLLGDLLNQLERTCHWGTSERRFSKERAELVASNLKKLREIQEGYYQCVTGSAWMNN